MPCLGTASPAVAVRHPAAVFLSLVEARVRGRNTKAYITVSFYTSSSSQRMANRRRQSSALYSSPVSLASLYKIHNTNLKT